MSHDARSTRHACKHALRKAGGCPGTLGTSPTPHAPARPTPSTAKRHDADRQRWSMLACVCASVRGAPVCLVSPGSIGGDDGAPKATRETTRWVFTSRRGPDPSPSTTYVQHCSYAGYREGTGNEGERRRVAAAINKELKKNTEKIRRPRLLRLGRTETRRVYKERVCGSEDAETVKAKQRREIRYSCKHTNGGI